MDTLPTPGLQRCWWLREAMAAENAPAPAPPLEAETDADVVIIGGGYTGMWSAYFLIERAPGTRVVLLEQDICGGGPSGRNGGFVHGWWEDLPYLVERYGHDAGLQIAREADEVVDGIGGWCEAHEVDAWYTKGGYLTINAFPRRPSDWGPLAAQLRVLGVGDQLVPVSADEVQRRCASPAFGDGLWMPSAASIQPARLARGLRRVLLERGVRIHEGTTVRSVQPEGARLRISASGGSVLADQAILGINAWAAGWPGFRSRVLTWGSYMVVTEPIPEPLAEIGWTGGELLSDDRFTISYFRTTADGRIAFGAGVGSAGFGGGIGKLFTHDQRAVRRVVANLDHLLPMLSDVRLDDAWGGPIDVTGHKFPEIGSLGGRLHYAHGFGGNGAGPSRFAGRILAALADDPADPLARLPLVGRRQPVLPPEPIRFVGARMIREALIRQDDAYDAGHRPGPIVNAVARLPRLLGYRLGH